MTESLCYVVAIVESLIFGAMAGLADIMRSRNNSFVSFFALAIVLLTAMTSHNQWPIH
jgi:hypothetical protein